MKLFNSIKEISKYKYFSNVNEGIKPFLLKELNNIYSEQNIMVILNNNSEIDQYYDLFKNYFKCNNILKFPSWDIVPYEETSPSQVILNERFKSLNNIIINDNKKKSYLVLTNVDSVLQLLPLKLLLTNNYFEVKIKQNLSLEILNSNLYSIGYERVEIVLEPQEYAVRGGIIDIWPLGEDYPIRVDFFGDRIDSIKTFNPISQITINEQEKKNIFSSIESPRDKKANKIFIENYRKKFGPSTSKELFVHKLKNNIRADGIENWLPLFYSSDLIDLTEFFDIKLIIADDSFLERAKKN